MDTGHFRLHVIRPVLEHLHLHSAEAENLLVGTAVHESGGLRWLAQLGGGPALGIFQLEAATHDDIWQSFLRFRPALAARVGALAAPWPLPRSRQLVTNLAYATAMARIHYRRVPEPLPRAGDIEAQARYWKAHYNTVAGAGCAAEFVENYRRYAG